MGTPESEGGMDYTATDAAGNPIYLNEQGEWVKMDGSPVHDPEMDLDRNDMQDIPMPDGTMLRYDYDKGEYVQGPAVLPDPLMGGLDPVENYRPLSNNEFFDLYGQTPAEVESQYGLSKAEFHEQNLPFLDLTDEELADLQFGAEPPDFSDYEPPTEVVLDDGSKLIWNPDTGNYMNEPAPVDEEGFSEEARRRAEEAIAAQPDEPKMWNPIEDRPYEPGEDTEWWNTPEYLAGELDPENFPSQPYIKENPDNLPTLPPEFEGINPYPVTDPWELGNSPNDPKNQPGNPLYEGLDPNRPTYNPGFEMPDFENLPVGEYSGPMVEILRQQGQKIVTSGPQKLADALRSGFKTE